MFVRQADRRMGTPVAPWIVDQRQRCGRALHRASRQLHQFPSSLTYGLGDLHIDQLALRRVVDAVADDRVTHGLQAEPLEGQLDLLCQGDFCPASKWC